MFAVSAAAIIIDPTDRSAVATSPAIIRFMTFLPLFVDVRPPLSGDVRFEVTHLMGFRMTAG
jgi:hypothetical protein